MRIKLDHGYAAVALLLPALGLAGMVVRAEIAVRSGPSFRIPIRGYDPRDLFHGRYLQYQFDFDWRGQDSCPSEVVATNRFVGVGGPVPLGVRVPTGGPGPVGGSVLPTNALAYGCCLCLTRTRSDGFNPAVRQVDCDEPKSNCDGWLRAQEVMPPLRFFVPEDKAQELEQAMRARKPSVDFSVTPGGTPAIRELYLDDRAWRSATAK